MRGTLYHTIRALLLHLSPTETDVGYHTNPANKRAFGWHRREGFRVDFESDSYFVRLNCTKGKESFEVLLGHTRDRKRSGNTADISFTELHFGSHLLLSVAPSLTRCTNKSLAREPLAIGDFPARVVGTTNHFLIGFPDACLFPRLFRLCKAKVDSMPPK